MTLHETYRYLENIEKINLMIDNKLLEKEDLYTLATKTTQSMDGMPHGSGISDKVGNIAIRLQESENEINTMIDLLWMYKREVISNIQKLPSNYYSVLYQHYILDVSVQDIAYNENKTRQSVNGSRKQGVLKLSSIVKRSELMELIEKRYFSEDERR